MGPFRGFSSRLHQHIFTILLFASVSGLETFQVNQGCNMCDIATLVSFGTGANKCETLAPCDLAGHYAISYDWTCVYRQRLKTTEDLKEDDIKPPFYSYELKWKEGTSFQPPDDDEEFLPAGNETAEPIDGGAYRQRAAAAHAPPGHGRYFESLELHLPYRRVGHLKAACWSGGEEGAGCRAFLHAWGGCDVSTEAVCLLFTGLRESGDVVLRFQWAPARPGACHLQYDTRSTWRKPLHAGLLWGDVAAARRTKLAVGDARLSVGTAYSAHEAEVQVRGACGALLQELHAAFAAGFGAAEGAEARPRPTARPQEGGARQLLRRAADEWEVPSLARVELVGYSREGAEGISVFASFRGTPADRTVREQFNARHGNLGEAAAQCYRATGVKLLAAARDLETAESVDYTNMTVMYRRGGRLVAHPTLQFVSQHWLGSEESLGRCGKVLMGYAREEDCHAEHVERAHFAELPETFGKRWTDLALEDFGHDFFHSPLKLAVVVMTVVVWVAAMSYGYEALWWLPSCIESHVSEDFAHTLSQKSAPPGARLAPPRTLRHRLERLWDWVMLWCDSLPSVRAMTADPQTGMPAPPPAPKYSAKVRNAMALQGLGLQRQRDDEFSRQNAMEQASGNREQMRAREMQRMPMELAARRQEDMQTAYNYAFGGTNPFHNWRNPFANR